MVSNRYNLSALALVLIGAVLFAIAIWREPQAEGKRLGTCLRELKVGVKVLTESDGTHVVFLPNLSDQELRNLNLSSKIRAIPSSSGMGRVYLYDMVELCHQDVLERDPAARAIRSIGPKALPLLRARLHVRESKITVFYGRMWLRLPAYMQAYLTKPIHPTHMRAQAAFALGLLGADARVATPELQELFQKDKDNLVRSVAREALDRINPKIVGPFYPELFEKTPPVIREQIMENTNSLFEHPIKLSL